MKEKTKKILKFFAVCAMALVSCFTVFACKETPPTDPDTEQTPSSGQTPSGGSQNPGGSTTVVDYTVTEDEWTTATNVVASGNATMTMSQTTSSGSSISASNCVMKFDGTTYYLEESGGSAYITKVTEGSETKYYEYNYDNDKNAWEKTERNASYFEQSAGYMSFPGRFAYSENFQYDTENHEYVATNHIVMGQTFAKVALGFENKKCVKLYYEIEGMGSATFTFVYGTTETITLPPVSEAPATPSTPSGTESGESNPSGSEQNPSEGNPSEGEQNPDDGQNPSGGTVVVGYTVTETEWTSAIAPSAFENVTISMDVAYGEDAFTQTFKFDGTNAYEESEGDEYYYSKEGDQYYGYQKEGANWKKTEIGEEGYGMYVLSQVYTFAMFTYDESAYTYNSETHAYEAENITIGEGDESTTFTKVALYFENGVLVKFYYEMNQSYSDTPVAVSSIMTLTYGNVVITLPTVAE